MIPDSREKGEQRIRVPVQTMKEENPVRHICPRLEVLDKNPMGSIAGVEVPSWVWLPNGHCRLGPPEACCHFGDLGREL